MPTAYVRRVNLKSSLSDAEVVAYWKFTMEEVLPAILRVPGIRSAKVYSGAGGLRADIRYVEGVSHVLAPLRWLVQIHTD